ncbi:MAG: peptide chain release factor 3 [Christensenellaceae bacterium]|jgi:peptide chain release factor 3|nr:peptide chain release factor 3 [Christensenellaceae bacterium]
MQVFAQDLRSEIARRRTFAIISHPDAGKTTLTEKLLLYGGAIRLAGSVKARKAERHATSDWMEIEKQRGISVTSSVMQFEFGGYHINILDTPGHQDFSEDTYRTLVAADCAVMLIDAARGVEAQTIKLFQVCRMRGIPIFTFVNKMDRAARDPFELMEEIEKVLGIRACPVTWPIGTNGDFQGVYHRFSRRVELFEGGRHGSTETAATFVDEGGMAERLEPYYVEKLREDVELLDIAGDDFDLQSVREGRLSPLFFGSAMNNFGVESFLRYFLEYSLPPLPRLSGGEAILPETPGFSGFIFKIQANMNPAHRDRVAFLRICSGVFEKGMSVRQASSGKEIRLAQPQAFMADARESVEIAYPGDIIGLFDPGIYALGDTLYAGESVSYEGIPLFAPEHFARVSTPDSLKRKQFIKGMTQLSEEGAVQVFRRKGLGFEELIAGAVGVLQFDVLKYRLEGEYGAEVRIQPLSYSAVRWVAEAPGPIERLRLTSATLHALDRFERPVLLFETEWQIVWALENNPGLKLSSIAQN